MAKAIVPLRAQLWQLYGQPNGGWVYRVENEAGVEQAVYADPQGKTVLAPELRKTDENGTTNGYVVRGTYFLRWLRSNRDYECIYNAAPAWDGSVDDLWYTGGGGGGVSKDYVDTQDTATLGTAKTFATTTVNAAVAAAKVRKWKSYAPDFSPKAKAAGWDMGNAVRKGGYTASAGGMCIVEMVINFGTTTKFGTGNMEITLPLPCVTDPLQMGTVNGATSNSQLFDANATEGNAYSLINCQVAAGESAMRISYLTTIITGALGLVPVQADAPIALDVSDSFQVPDFNYSVDPKGATQ